MTSHVAALNSLEFGDPRNVAYSAEFLWKTNQPNIGKAAVVSARQTLVGRFRDAPAFGRDCELLEGY